MEMTEASAEKSKPSLKSSFSIDSILTSKNCDKSGAKRVNVTSKKCDQEENKHRALDLTNTSHPTEEVQSFPSNNYYNAMYPTVNVPFAEYYLERLSRMRGHPGPFRYTGSGGYMGSYMSEEAKRYFQTRYNSLPPGFQTYCAPTGSNDHPNNLQTDVGNVKSETKYDLKNNITEHDYSDIEIDENDGDDASVDSHRNAGSRRDISEHEDSSLDDEDDDDINDYENDSDITEDKEDTKSKTVNDNDYSTMCPWDDNKDTTNKLCHLNKKGKRQLGKIMRVSVPVVIVFFITI